MRDITLIIILLIFLINNSMSLSSWSWTRPILRSGEIRTQGKNSFQCHNCSHHHNSQCVIIIIIFPIIIIHNVIIVIIIWTMPILRSGEIRTRGKNVLLSELFRAARLEDSLNMWDIVIIIIVIIIPYHHRCHRRHHRRHCQHYRYLHHPHQMTARLEDSLNMWIIIKIIIFIPQTPARLTDNTKCQHASGLSQHLSNHHQTLSPLPVIASSSSSWLEVVNNAEKTLCWGRSWPICHH